MGSVRSLCARGSRQAGPALRNGFGLGMGGQGGWQAGRVGSTRVL